MSSRPADGPGVVEIKTTVSLQHPHGLPLFDSGTADGFLFYVIHGQEAMAKGRLLSGEDVHAGRKPARLTVPGKDHAFVRPSG